MKYKGNLSLKLYNKKTVNKIQNKINLLGVSCKYDAITFLNARLFTSIIVFFVVLIFSSYGYILSIVFVILYYYLFERILLDEKIKKRVTKLNNESIYFFEVLTLSLQTGRNLIEAVSITVNSVDSEISREFKEAIRQTRFGKSLTESLNDMQANIPSDSINNIILTLTQADLYGNSIIESLYSQIDYLREKKKLEMKAVISKVPIKVSVISVLFFVPLVLLIILAPILLNYLN